MKVKDIKFCTKCFYSSEHPLGITFDENGVCSGCNVHEEKNQIDWKSRFVELENLLKIYRSKNKNYDCIVPITGAQDSYYIIHLVKNILKLNPLLVSYNKYFNTEIGIKNLSNLRIKFDCDIVFKNVNPNTIKKITKFTLSEYGNIYWPILAGQSVFPLEISEKYKIPLIIWGAHQGIEQVGMFSHLDNVEMNRRYRNEHDLFGYEAEDLLQIDNSLNDDDIWQFKYPSDKIIKSNGIRGIYLSNYFRWDPYSQHQMMVKKFGYIGRKFNRTFDIYDYVDCFNYMEIHDYLKILKHGYSKVTDHVCREIRHKRLNRYQGLKLINKYELQFPKYLELFCEWLDIDRKSLEFILNRFRNPKYFQMKSDLSFNYLGLSKKYIKNLDLKKETTHFKFDKEINQKNKNFIKKYITFGKGYP